MVVVVVGGGTAGRVRSVDVEGAVKDEWDGQGADLGDEAAEVGVGRTLDVERVAADVVDGLVVEHDVDVGVLEEEVVRLDDRVGDLWGRARREVSGRAFDRAKVDG